MCIFFLKIDAATPGPETSNGTVQNISLDNIIANMSSWKKTHQDMAQSESIQPSSSTINDASASETPTPPPETSQTSTILPKTEPVTTNRVKRSDPSEATPTSGNTGGNAGANTGGGGSKT